ncbi:MAG: hypothetical protein KAZ17_00205, partial [Sphingorhabdus sp.]|nr:hypothetical protein [Sphingorhabdus sp.]
GLSEIFPATAAPLGDTARALIAFAVGALTLIVLMAVTMRKPIAVKGTTQSDSSKSAATSTQPSSFDNARSSAGMDDEPKATRGFKMPNITMPKMPWARGEDDISDLADLSKLQTSKMQAPILRSGDSHPDAPPRRPISALVDLADTDNPSLVSAKQPIVVAASVPEAPAAFVPPRPIASQFEQQPAQMAAPIWQGPPPEARPIPEHFAADIAASNARIISPNTAMLSDAKLSDATMPTQTEMPTLAEMIAQMEAAVEQRKQQLAELETVASEILAMKVNGEYPVTPKPTPAPIPAPIPSPTAEPRFTVPQSEAIWPEIAPTAAIAPLMRPALEVVSSRPQPAAADDDMDAALHAALETLQRMNR